MILLIINFHTQDKFVKTSELIHFQQSQETVSDRAYKYSVFFCAEYLTAVSEKRHCVKSK